MKFEEWVFSVNFGDAALYEKHSSYMSLAFNACAEMKDQRITHLESVIKDMGESLEFYGDIKRWYYSMTDSCKHKKDHIHSTFISEIDIEEGIYDQNLERDLFGGKIARETLSKHKELLDQLTTQAEKDRG